MSPLANSLCTNILFGSGKLRCNTQFCDWLQCREDILQQLIVAVRSLYEYLRLVLGNGSTFELFKSLYTSLFVYGQITDKSKVLSIEPACHQRKYYRRRTYERYHFYIFCLSQSHHIGTRVGYCRTPRFGYNPHRMPLV